MLVLYRALSGTVEKRHDDSADPEQTQWMGPSLFYSTADDATAGAASLFLAMLVL
jgi:hypothetical protein